MSAFDQNLKPGKLIMSLRLGYLLFALLLYIVPSIGKQMK